MGIRRDVQSGSGRAGHLPKGKQVVQGGEMVEVRRGPVTLVNTEGWGPTCTAGDRAVVPCEVFDPFCGSGTTLEVAVRNGCFGWGTELSPEYALIAKDRLAGKPEPLLDLLKEDVITDHCTGR